MDAIPGDYCQQGHEGLNVSIAAGNAALNPGHHGLGHLVMFTGRDFTGQSAYIIGTFQTLIMVEIEVEARFASTLPSPSLGIAPLACYDPFHYEFTSGNTMDGIGWVSNSNDQSILATFEKYPHHHFDAACDCAPTRGLIQHQCTGIPSAPRRGLLSISPSCLRCTPLQYLSKAPIKISSGLDPVSRQLGL